MNMHTERFHIIWQCVKEPQHHCHFFPSRVLARRLFRQLVNDRRKFDMCSCDAKKNRQFEVTKNRERYVDNLFSANMDRVANWAMSF